MNRDNYSDSALSIARLLNPTHAEVSWKSHESENYHVTVQIIENSILLLSCVHTCSYYRS